jgi:hypothetical protein
VSIAPGAARARRRDAALIGVDIPWYYHGPVARPGRFVAALHHQPGEKLKMTFGEAISQCFSKYAEFNGRASKSEFWWWMLFILLASLACRMISPLLSSLFSLATLLPSLAVTARRLHDIGRSGWWQLICLIPLLGWIVLVYWCVQDAKD